MDEVFSIRMPVRFQDIDAAGIVFFARVFDYAHDAFTAYLRSIELPLDRILNDGNVGIPLVHAEADYTGPLRFGDDVDVAIGRVEIGTKSIKVQFALTVAGRPAATIRHTHVTTLMRDMKAVPVPDDWRQKLLAPRAE